MITVSEILIAARALRDRLASDAALAKDRAEYLRTVANWNDAARLVSGLEQILSDGESPDRDRIEAANLVLDLDDLTR